jgi:hypothetical protein
LIKISDVQPLKVTAATRAAARLPRDELRAGTLLREPARLPGGQFSTGLGTEEPEAGRRTDERHPDQVSPTTAMLAEADAEISRLFQQPVG